MAAQVAEHPVLLIVTFRPEYAVPWPLPAATAELALSRLEQRHCARLVARLGEAEGLTPELQSQIVDKAEGVPLFLEELTKSVLESGLAADSEAGAKFQLTVPATLHDALMARLDRLASVKVIAQTAAALGREFSYRMLAACAGLGRRRLRQGLTQLTEAGLLFCKRSATRCQLYLQARAGARRCLQLPAAEPAGGAACRDCSHTGSRIHQGGEHAAGGSGLPLHRGRVDRAGNSMVAAGRRSGPQPIGACRSDQPHPDRASAISKIGHSGRSETTSRANCGSA